MTIALKSMHDASIIRPTHAPYGLFAMSDRSRIRRVGILPTIAMHPLEQTMIEAGDAHDDHCAQYSGFIR